MTTWQSFLTALQKYPLINIRSCLTSIIPKFSTNLIFHRYPFLPLQHSKNKWSVAVGCICFFSNSMLWVAFWFSSSKSCCLFHFKFFPSYQPMMKNSFRNFNSGIIHDVFCNGRIFPIIPNQ